MNEATIDRMARECIGKQVRQLNRVVTNVYNDALRPLGLKMSQLNILIAAVRLGLARPAVVCERLDLDASTLSRNVERMRAQGWLEVVEDEDGRAQPFRLTAKGNKLVEKSIPAWQRAQRKAVSLLGKEGVASLRRASNAI